MQVSPLQGKRKLESHLKLNIRLHNYPESMIALKNLKAAYIGKAQVIFDMILNWILNLPDIGCLVQEVN